jgi:phosphoserine phosphatase
VLAFSGPDGQRALTGDVIPPIRDKNDKLEQLIQESANSRIQLSETIAVGDGANDLPMLLSAGLGVAYHAKPSVKDAARARVDHAGLKALLFAQGYKSDEILS